MTTTAAPLPLPTGRLIVRSVQRLVRRAMQRDTFAVVVVRKASGEEVQFELARGEQIKLKIADGYAPVLTQ